MIASEIVKHFTDKSVPVLVVHDSFMIEDKYETKLKSVMISEYMNIMKHKPII